MTSRNGDTAAAGGLPDAPCRHLARSATAPDPLPLSDAGCEECLLTGSTWNALRLCLSCGHVGCCDDSPYRHARAHYAVSDHPVIRSHEPAEDWTWCYPDNLGSAAAPP